MSRTPENENAGEPGGLSLLRLVAVMEEQVDILRRMEERQRAADLSNQPMPEVPATSTSAWNALLRSTLAESIQPKVERWRSGLDALLVFLGLFSAVVTSFFVQSLTGLQQDETAVLVQLVSNLTDIVIALSGVPSTDLDIQQPAAFQPASSDVRLNAYWSLSLILSLSIAALAVACRGFLNAATTSSHTKASAKLIDIRTRWHASSRILGPTIEILPQLLVVPVMLFIAGLLDTMFSSVLSLSPIPVPILATSGLSLAFVLAVALLLGWTLANPGINPTGTAIPFRVLERMKSWAVSVGTSHAVSRHNTLRRAPRRVRKQPSAEHLSASAHLVYHDVVQSTHDDDTLNEAAAALYSVIQTFSVWPRYTVHASTTAGASVTSGLLAQERATLMHLLSPEASVRSNRTAAQVILRMQTANRIRYSETDMTELVPALLNAARLRLAVSPMQTLWDSPFVHAMAVVGNAGALCDPANQDTNSRTVCVPAVAFLASDYIDVQQLPSDSDPSSEHALRTRTISFIAEMLFSAVFATVAGPGADKSPQGRHALDAAVDDLLQPIALVEAPKSLSPSRKSTLSSDVLQIPLRQPNLPQVNAESLVGAFLYLPLPSRSVTSQPASGREGKHPATRSPDAELVLKLLLRWLTRQTSPATVIAAAEAHVGRVIRPDIWPTVLFFVVATLARTLLEPEPDPSNGPANIRQWLIPLARLCVSALRKIAMLHQFHPQLPGLVSCAADAVAQARNIPVDATLSRDHDILAAMRPDLVEIRAFIADGSWRWSAKERSDVLRRLDALEKDTNIWDHGRDKLQNSP
ncbi:hypothetical protein HMN09_00153100 [Mycena chlorophos]|uniref:DUF6535 domain-containing protein n=1 Tax=Mycena chlorophos TaxID=658473 RepID=A0A8H6WQC7_MYCCL|nr:hypothetical protein HMN09_00153100 [Mycena chlorophos]